MEEIVSQIAANGVWAVLFCCLLVYLLRDGRRRENKYIGTIDALADRFGALNDVKSDTAEIKDEVADVKTDTREILHGLDRICDRSDAAEPEHERGGDESACAGKSGGAPCANAI